MTRTSPAISVAVLDQAAFIKVPGRANFNTSVDFKRLVQDLRQKGCARFVLDLSECSTMDSTFLGVLAGIALRDIDGKEAEPETPRVQLDLLNPNARVTDLLENLGVVHLFNILQQAIPCTAIFEPRTNGEAPSREQIARTCLDAHVTLMDIQPENIPKFKDVAEFFAQDLKKATSSTDETQG